MNAADVGSLLFSFCWLALVAFLVHFGSHDREPAPTEGDSLVGTLFGVLREGRRLRIWRRN